MTGDLRILLTISRRWKRWQLLREVLTAVYAAYPDAVLVHGDCPDGDRQAAGIWRQLGSKDEPHPADWKLGRHAGFKRSEEMVKLGAIRCFAFIRNASSGASHCAALAEAAGIKTRRYTYEEGL